MPSKAIDTVRTLVVDQAWVAILATFLTIVLSLVLSELQGRIGLPTLVASLVIVVAVFLAVTWLVVRNVVSVLMALAERIEDIVSKHIATDKVEWIVSTEQMVKFEKRTNAHDIWLISSDLSEDSVGAPFAEIVRSNLKKGVRYRYFVPSRPEIRSRIEQLTRYHKDSPNLSICYLNDDFYFLVPKFDFAIYNPFNEQGAERAAYMGLPLDGEQRHYHARVGDDLTDVLVGKLVGLTSDRRQGH